jgi:hypothetical protein
LGTSVVSTDAPNHRANPPSGVNTEAGFGGIECNSVDVTDRRKEVAEVASVKSAETG